MAEERNEFITKIEEAYWRRKLNVPKYIEWQYSKVKCPECYKESWIINNYEYEDGWIHANCYCENCKLKFRMYAIVVAVEG
jgi:hypothetical protein